jgi:hypothetical protein
MNGSPSSAIRLIGGLLPGDVLERLDLLSAKDPRALPSMKAGDYGLVETESIRDAIARSWSRLLHCWGAFQLARERGQSDGVTPLTRKLWLKPLLQELGWGDPVHLPAAQTVGNRDLALSHWGQPKLRSAPVPIHLMGWDTDLERRTGNVKGAALAPHSLVQEILNHDDAALWGLVSNGRVLRILRDQKTLSRVACIEFDLEAIFDGNLMSDFARLWLLAHASRFDGETPETSPLEVWFRLSRSEGVNALADLRKGVEAAIVALGRGFLDHRLNGSLREALASGALSHDDYYRRLLRIVYRLIFLFAAEDRGALLDPAADAESAQRYNRWYATRQLRARSSRAGAEVADDRWQALRTVMTGLYLGEPALALPALGSSLWDPAFISPLNSARLGNESLLAAVRSLAFTVRQNKRFPVDFRHLGAEELGSVYESLLELHGKVDVEARTFALVGAAGNDRKTTGSYYTPSSLVENLLDTALDPLITHTVRGKKGDEAAAALLSLTICDPSCGSGHFLLAAARRLARQVAQCETHETEPSPEAYHSALRRVIARCLFGVDLNEMAVELCKVGLWLEGLEPGRPLSFLDAHLQVGNSLLGATPELVAKGIPAAAWELLPGDKKEHLTTLKKQVRDDAKRVREGQFLLDELALQTVGAKELSSLIEANAPVEAVTLAEVQAQAESWRRYNEEADYLRTKHRFDAWCAAFVWPKASAEDVATAPTPYRWQSLSAGAAMRGTLERVASITDELRFFHWPLQFPQVFARGGFDLMLGNPPWERLKADEQEFFAVRDPIVAAAANAAARKTQIAALQTNAPWLWNAWQGALRASDGASHLVRNSGRYPLCGRGDVNTYSVFAEHIRDSLRRGGRAGFIVPTGIATDDTTKFFFQDLLDRQQLAHLLCFENEEFIFPAVHHAFKFALVTLSSKGLSPAADLMFFARQAAELSDRTRHFSLTPAEFAVLNPNTRTCPTFRSRRDADLNLEIYRRTGVLWSEGELDDNPWGIRFARLFDMSNDSELFYDRKALEGQLGWFEGNHFDSHGDGEESRYLPLYEGKMLHHFDHRFGSYDGQTEAQANQGKLPELTAEQHADPELFARPRYWVAESEIEEALAPRYNEKGHLTWEGWSRPWMLGWRDITGASVLRTVIASVIPRVAAGHKVPLILSYSAPASVAVLLANLSSFVLDYTARQKLGGSSLTFFIVKQLPVLAPERSEVPAPWDARHTIRAWMLPRMLELTFTAWDMEGWAADLGHVGAPFRWDDDRRALLRAELDAAFFHLYELTREETEHILETFPIVRSNEENAFGEYRSRRLILAAYDAMATATATGTPYATPLSPAPADLSLTHDAETRPSWLGRRKSAEAAEEETT